MSLNILSGSLILVLVTTVAVVIDADKCPRPEDIMPCRCRGRNDQIQVWCSHSDLDRVNGALENLMRLRSMPAIDELIVENNKMPSLPARAFGALRIGRLLLRHNGLESISRNAFAGLENSLEELYIVEDKLLDFPFDAIEQLKNLEAFTVEQSKIRLLPKFIGLNRLRHIRIDGSQISGLPVGAFAKMAAIKQIHVVNSNLGSLAEGIFGPLDTLRLLNFTGNQINLIQRRSFALLTKLEVLSMAKNHLVDAVSVGRACEELTSLKSLDLSTNNFKVLPEGSFVHLRTLQMLNLADNQIQTVSPRSFTHLPALRKVDLSQNELRNFPKLFFDSSPLLEELRMRKNLLSSANEIGELLNSLKSLRFLDLGENGITILQSGTITDHSQLQKIDLSDNLIRSIQRDAFRNVPSLVELSLRNNSLTELPSDDYEAWRIPSLVELDVSSNKIQNLALHAFSQLPQLIRLDLSYNNIKSIASALFSTNQNLEQLEIIGNGLNFLAFNSLSGLGKLKHLDLSRNHLDTLQSTTFRDLVNLQVLNLANNRITTIPSDLLNTLKFLEEFSMKSNSLKYIPSGFFISLENLKELNLKQNAIADISVRMFSDLKNLRSLKLASNQITHIDDTAFNELEKVKSIDISSNRITRLSKATFKSLQSLEKFDARENRITFIENGTFENLEKIQMLDLAHNALESIPDVIKSPSLKIIDFSHNQINHIQSNGFEFSRSLMELYLNDNKLKVLEPQTLNNLESLTIVDLDGNELTEIRGETFRNLPRLIYLRLSRNQIRVINNHAFMGLTSLDGIDLQQNELESIGEAAFERTASLKYLNLSHNNFDDMSRMGLFPLQSLEVLDISFNRLRIFDDKALRHLQWLVELRVNDNGICTLPVGVFDGMSRLKMLILKNNSISHLYETVFYKLKNNIAFIDISGNPIACDCELLWFRNLMTQETFRELSESTCDSPNDLRGIPIKTLRPGRLICTNSNNNRLRGISSSKNNEQLNCPMLPMSKRKPRPVSPEPFQKPVFADTTPPQVDNTPGETDFVESVNNDSKHNRKHKDEKWIQSNDYIAGDSPTIYAGSITTPIKGQNDGKVSSGLSALSTLFGIPIPNLDFGLNLDISPSITVAQKNSNGHTNEQNTNTRGFIPGFKRPDPLPPSWIDRPSKDEHVDPVTYEPPEYIPRKPIQPYIPLNPYAESNTQTNIVPPKTRGKTNAAFTSSSHSYPPRVTVTNLPQTSWHPTYPTVETGFIPIEPFFHSVAAGKGSTKRKSSTKIENTNFYITNSGLGNTTPLYENEFPTTTIRNELSTPTVVPFAVTMSPIIIEDDEDGVDTQSADGNEDHTQTDSLSDFWGMFTGEKKNGSNQDDRQGEKMPLDFSSPIDTEMNSGTTKAPGLNDRFSPYNQETEGIGIGDSFHENPYGTSNQVTQDSKKSNSKGKSTITKVKLDETSRVPYTNPPKTPTTNALSFTNNQNGNYVSQASTPRKPPLVPPVLIGGPEEPLDWYYKNYNTQQNPEEEIEKYLERSRVNQAEDVLIDVGSAFSTKLISSIPLTVAIIAFTIAGVM